MEQGDQGSDEEMAMEVDGTGGSREGELKMDELVDGVATLAIS